jgi:hypothetical protein
MPITSIMTIMFILLHGWKSRFNSIGAYVSWIWHGISISNPKHLA